MQTSHSYCDRSPLYDRAQRLARILPDIEDHVYDRLAPVIEQQMREHLEIIRQELIQIYQEKYNWSLPPALVIARESKVIMAYQSCIRRLCQSEIETIMRGSHDRS
ncbi:MAG: hypothetical protein AAF228_05955 [Pseudomonadota bacterium]